MRSSSVRTVARAAGSLGAAVLLAAWLATCLATAVLAAEPSASPGAGGDPRSPGQGPGLVGEPGVAIAIVVAVGLLAVGGTLLYVRATGGPRSPS